MARSVACSLHRDDFTTVGPMRSFNWFKSELETKHELKEASELGLENSKPVSTPGVRHTMEQIHSDTDLPEAKIAQFRALAMVTLSCDRQT